MSYLDDDYEDDDDWTPALDPAAAEQYAAQTDRWLKLMGEAGEKAAAARALQQEANAVYDVVDKERLAIIAAHLGHTEPTHLVFGTQWECPDSLTGHCVWDAVKDRWMDYCLYCDQPRERK